MSDFEFVLVHGNDFNLQTKVFEFVIGGGRGATGSGLPSGGTNHQLVRKVGIVNFVYELFTLTKDFIGLGNVTDHAQLKRVAGDFLAFPQKITPANGDWLLIEDGADGSNKKYILIDSLLGGGGGSLWEVLESRGMIGNSTEIFTVGTDDNIMFLFGGLVLGGNNSLLTSVSLDGGVTYPSRHNYMGMSQAYGSADANFQAISVAAAKISNLSFQFNFRGFVKFDQVAGAGTKVTYDSEVSGETNLATPFRAEMSGNFRDAGTVDRVKFVSGQTIDSGTIHHLKRLI